MVLIIKVVVIKLAVCVFNMCVCDCTRPRLRQELHGFTYLIEVLDLTLRCAEEAQRQLNDQEVDLCCEVLKILFNVTVGMEATSLDEVNLLLDSLSLFSLLLTCIFACYPVSILTGLILIYDLFPSIISCITLSF